MENNILQNSRNWLRKEKISKINRATRLEAEDYVNRCRAAGLGKDKVRIAPPHFNRMDPAKLAEGISGKPHLRVPSGKNSHAEKAEVMCGKLGSGKPACIKAFRGPFGGGPYLSMACPYFAQMLSTSTPAASGHFVQRWRGI